MRNRLRFFLFIYVSFILVLPVRSFGQGSYFDGCAFHIGDCSYYACKAHQLNCDPQNYLLSFGASYCQKFRDATPQFSLRGKKWLHDVRTCLQVSLEEDQSLTCKNSWRHAVDTHLPCYLNAGFCELPASDKDKIARISRAEVLHPEILWQVIKIGLACQSRGWQN